MLIRCIVLKVFKGVRLLSVTPYPMVGGNKSALNASLELARLGKIKFEEHIDCGAGSDVWCELGFGKVDEHGNVTL